MSYNYTIILFKNKVRYKTYKEYKTYRNAQKFFEKLLKSSEDVYFEVKTEKGLEIEFELAIVEKNSKSVIPLFKTDSLGRNIEIKSDNQNLKIIRLEPFKIPEKLFHIETKKNIRSENFISSFLKSKNLKLISKLNNKIIIQNDDVFNLFSLKNESDANRFLNQLQKKLISENKESCLFIWDTDVTQKKYLYKILEDNGYNKKMLYRTSTTHLKGK